MDSDRLTQQRSIGLGEGPQESPAEHRAVWRRAGDMLLHRPVPRPMSQSRPTLPCSGPAWTGDPKPSRDHAALARACHRRIATRVDYL
jgi:hypothetical protein